MRTLFSALLLAALVSAQAPAVKPPPDEAAAGFQTINPDDCKKWLSRLASDEFEGRETGTPGFQKAADMVAAHFKEIGLKPVGDKDSQGNPTYFQNVPFIASALDPETARFEVTGGKEPIVIKQGEGYGATGSGTLAAHGPIAFVFVQQGQGKLSELDVKGKVVIVVAVDAEGALVRVPNTVLSDLKKPGPAAVVKIDDVVAARGLSTGSAQRKDIAERNERGMNARRGADRAPNVAISRAVAESLATAGGKDFAALVAKAKGGANPETITTKLTAKIDLATKIVDIGVPNCVGFLEGSDPVLKNELVIIGSHLDHLGRSPTGEVFNGADDDGSGSTGLLAVSRAFAKNTRPPKRSVLFLAFCGEEKGLLGSDWYVEHPIYPHTNVIAELQMDMIGRHEEALAGENPGSETAEDNVNTLHLIGAKRIAPQLNEMIERINGDHTKFVFEYDQESVYERSDHYNFAKKGIPIAFFFTGFHADYHRITDDVEKIDFPKLARVAQLVYLTGWELGERPEKLPVEKGKKASPK